MKVLPDFHVFLFCLSRLVTCCDTRFVLFFPFLSSIRHCVLLFVVVFFSCRCAFLLALFRLYTRKRTCFLRLCTWNLAHVYVAQLLPFGDSFLAFRMVSFNALFSIPFTCTGITHLFLYPPPSRPKRKEIGYAINSYLNIWMKRTEQPNGGVSIRSRNGAPSRKGCVVNG